LFYDLDLGISKECTHFSLSQALLELKREEIEFCKQEFRKTYFGSRKGFMLALYSTWIELAASTSLGSP
jgi:hypothetical protein